MTDPRERLVPALRVLGRRLLEIARGPVGRIVIITLVLRVVTTLMALMAQVTIPAYQDQGYSG